MKNTLTSAIQVIADANHVKYSFAQINQLLQALQQEVNKIEEAQKKGLEKKEPVTKPKAKENPIAKK